jgi:mannan polymerase II complex MNN10 subunit
MSALSGLCPQRRVAKGVDSEQFILLGDNDRRTDARSGGWLEHLGSFKNTDVQINWWKSSKTILSATIVVIFGLLLAVGVVLQTSEVLLQRANHFGRRCSHTGVGSDVPRKYNFAMVSCSDGSKSIPFRSFEGIMDLVIPNKQSYVDRHGYAFIDASDVLDKNRPPSWSKILAVKKHLPNYDYIFWNDAVSAPSLRFRSWKTGLTSSMYFVLCLVCEELMLFSLYNNLVVTVCSNVYLMVP